MITMPIPLDMGTIFLNVMMSRPFDFDTCLDALSALFRMHFRGCPLIPNYPTLSRLNQLTITGKDVHVGLIRIFECARAFIDPMLTIATLSDVAYFDFKLFLLIRF